MKTFSIWFLKILAVLALAIAGVVAGSFFIVDGIDDPYRYFGDVVIGFGVIGSTLLLGVLAWLITAWGAAGRTRVVAAVLSVLLVVSACLLNPFYAFKSVDPSPSIAWISPFEAFSENRSVGRPGSAVASFLSLRAETQATTGKADVVAAFNYKINKGRGWNYGGLALIPKVSASAEEYVRFRKAGIDSSFADTNPSDLGQDPVRLAWIHLAVPTLGMIAADVDTHRLTPPPFAVPPDYELALVKLDEVKQRAAFAPIYAEVVQLACKEKGLRCDSRFIASLTAFLMLSESAEEHVPSAKLLGLNLKTSDAVMSATQAALSAIGEAKKNEPSVDMAKLSSLLGLTEEDRLRMAELTRAAEIMSKKMSLLQIDQGSKAEAVSLILANWQLVQKSKNDAERIAALVKFFTPFE